jgi:hypothetical protein
VKEDIRHQLPEKVLLPDQKRDQPKIEKNMPSCDGLKQKDGDTNEQKVLNPWRYPAAAQRNTILLIGIAHSTLLDPYRP